MTTITSNRPIGVTLSFPAYINPIVVNPFVTIASNGHAVANGAGPPLIPWTIQNYGTIVASSTAGVGVDLTAGGAVTNAAIASISGGANGVAIYGSLGTVVNSGRIAGSAGIGVVLGAGGTITNAGTITGGGGTAVSFGGTASDRLVIDPGAVFNGIVAGSASASNTIELASGSSTGTLSGLGTSFTNFGSVTVDSGASWGLTGSNTLAAGSTLTNAGTLMLSGATLSDAGGLVNNGKVVLDPSTFNVASLTGTGAVTIDAGSTLAVQGTIGSGQDIVFGGTGGVFDINAPSQFGGTISGFVAGDTIDLTSTKDNGGHADMDYSTNVLTVTDNGNTYTLQFDQSESFAGDYFHLTPDNSGSGPGTDITENTTPCYCRGTLIRTQAGEVPVENLTIGNKVLTMSGAFRPIKWIGKRSYNGRFVIGRNDIQPVCIKLGALDERVPKRDLWISPNHAMYLDGLLIEAKDLINGASIVRAEGVHSIEYFHIELETHDVIIAEGALSESFIDDDSRFLFHNAHEYRALYPDRAKEVARYCASRLCDGYEVEAVRKRIAVRAGLISEEAIPSTGGLRGYIDRVSPDLVEGWAQNTDYPEAPVCLDLYAGGRLMAQVLANRYREDLKRAGIGSGHHSFAFTLPDGLAFASNAVEVRRSLDGAVLPASERAKRIGVSAAA